jgi:hypothetical protein
MFKFVKFISSLAKRLDERLTQGVDQHGRNLAGLKPARTARHTGNRRLARTPARSGKLRAGQPAAQYDRLGGLVR